jgi:hypothetical protein
VAVCRVCGTEGPENELVAVYGGGGGCLTCNGSPACTRCGHPRRQHRGAFSRGIERCETEVAVPNSINVGRCGCAGYTNDPAAYGETPDIVDVITFELRTAR